MNHFTCAVIVILAGICPYCKVQGSNDESLLCADGLKSIKPSNLCNHIPDCEDASDELNFKLCRVLSAYKSRCAQYGRVNEVQCKAQYSEFQYLSQKCMDLITACTLREKCLSNTDLTICDEIPDNKLKPPFMPPAIKKEEEFHHMLKYIEKSLNEAVKKNFRECPTFFVPLNEKKCLSLFTPAKVSWPEAKIFCESIGGELAIIDSLNVYTEVLEHIHKREIESQFWIGGFSKLGSTELAQLSNVTEIELGNTTIPQEWKWLNGDSIVMGAPFWSLYSVVINSNNNNKCGDFVQKVMPRYPYLEKTCLALLDKNHYYFSDELCHQRYAPMCITEKTI